MQRSSSWVVLPRSKFLAAVAVLALCLVLIEATEIVELPFEAQMSAALSSSMFSTSSLVGAMRSLGYGGLFALMALESMAVPVPSEVVLPFAGYLVYMGSMNYLAAVLVSVGASLCGSLVAYFVALLVGRPFFDALLTRVGFQTSTIDRAARWVNSRGAWAVLVARFVPGLISVVSIPAGLLNMRLRTFVLFTALGSAVWSSVLIYLGLSAGPLWGEVLSTTSVSLPVIELVVGVASGGYLSYYVATSWLAGHRPTRPERDTKRGRSALQGETQAGHKGGQACTLRLQSDAWRRGPPSRLAKEAGCVAGRLVGGGVQMGP